MNTKTPMALDEVLAVMDETIHCSDEEHMGLLGPELHQMLERARATIAALQSAHAEEVAGLRDTLLRNGLVPCDSPGCMCGDWHHRYGWPERFREFTEALENAGHPLTNANGNLALNALSELVRRAEQAEARLARVEADAKVLAYALSDNVAPHHLSHDVKCAIRKYVATTPTAGESHD